MTSKSQCRTASPCQPCLSNHRTPACVENVTIHRHRRVNVARSIFRWRNVSTATASTISTRLCSSPFQINRFPKQISYSNHLNTGQFFMYWHQVAFILLFTSQCTVLIYRTIALTDHSNFGSYGLVFGWLLEIWSKIWSKISYCNHLNTGQVRYSNLCLTTYVNVAILR